ncbi:hypothetical protein [Lederbergia graminis]|uniref:Group-specific protein n=1 Tax=Lederbergia graminis TaxID=735518 RepID=A0ABW0LMJ4_9BACI
MVRKTLILLGILLLQFNLCMVKAQNQNLVLVLDIETNKIIKTTPPNPNVQLETVKIMKAIDGIVKKINPIPNKGLMVKIPLEPSFHLENKWVNALIDEVIIIIPEDELPYLLLFDDENNSYFFTFETKIDMLINNIDIPRTSKDST